MPVRSLRQEEAVERAALLSVTSYDIAIDLTDLVDGPDFRAVSTMRFTATAGASTFVDCCAEVESATLNGEPLPAAEEGRIALAGPRRRTTSWWSPPSRATPRTGEGVHRAVDPGDDNVYLWTTFEPDEARYAWACFDQPDLKAPHAFTVTAPAAWTVVSNSGDPVVEDVEGGRRWTFEPTPPLSTYNPVVVAGPFVEMRQEAGGYDLGLYARQTLASALERDAEQLFTLTAQGLAFFGERFGMPFPQRSYDQVFLPEFGGAMENYGCVTWADDILRRHEPTTERVAACSPTCCCTRWRTCGSATSSRCAGGTTSGSTRPSPSSPACGRPSAPRPTATRPPTTWWATSWTPTSPTRDPARTRSASPCRPWPTPSRSSTPSPTPRARRCSSSSCTSSARTPSAPGMSAYFAEHAWGNTTLDDLVGSLEQASGRDLQPWRTAWLETAGVDRLGIEQTDDGLVLTAVGAHGAPHPQVVGVGAYRRAGDVLEEVGSTRVEVDGERTPSRACPRPTSTW